MIENELSELQEKDEKISQELLLGVCYVSFPNVLAVRVMWRAHVRAVVCPSHVYFQFAFTSRPTLPVRVK